MIPQIWLWQGVEIFSHGHGKHISFTVISGRTENEPCRGKLNFQINSIKWKVWLEILSNCVSFEEMRTVGVVKHLTLILPGETERGRAHCVFSPANRLVKGILEPDRVVHAYYPSTGNAEAGGYYKFRLAWSTLGV